MVSHNIATIQQIKLPPYIVQFPALDNLVFKYTTMSCVGKQLRILCRHT